MPDKGWIDAIELRAGDILVTCNGKYVVVEKVQHEILESPIKVYNFEVEDYHTYYVSSGNCSGLKFVLAHNHCDVKTNNTRNESIKFRSEREARSFARTKVGKNPIEVEPGKLLSRNLKWQYRAKPCDLVAGHIHLERLNPKTFEVIVNYHLRW